MSKLHFLSREAKLKIRDPLLEKSNEELAAKKYNNMTLEYSATTQPEFSTRFKTKLSSNLDDYIIGKVIGQGSYAVVKECIYAPTSEQYAIKIYDKIRLIDHKKKLNVIREIQNLELLRHKNIVQLYSVIDTPKQVMLVLELIKGKSLKSIMRENCKGLAYPQLSHITRQLLSAIEYCHSKCIVHRYYPL
jgi:serine/threonine protein kinase